MALQHADISVCLIAPGPVETELGKKGYVQGGRRLDVDGGQKKMTSKRCCQLMVIAIANKLSESWIADVKYELRLIFKPRLILFFLLLATVAVGHLFIRKEFIRIFPSYETIQRF